MRELVDHYGYVPTHCVWELTMACNMRCKHCGSAAGLERPRELTTEEALAVCDELAALGNRQLTISGGEPFLRHDWDQLVRRLTDHGIRVNAVSNGLALSERTVQRAIDAGLQNVGISLDGLRDTHNRIRSTPAAFDGVMRAWETCQRLGLPASTVTCIFRWNLDELEEIYQLLVANGITQWQIQLAEPMGNMAAYLQGLIDVEAVPRVLDLYNRAFTESDLGGACKTCSYGRICRGGCTSMSVTLAGQAHADPWCYQALREKQLSRQAVSDVSAQPTGRPLPLAPAALPTPGRPAAYLAAAWPG